MNLKTDVVSSRLFLPPRNRSRTPLRTRVSERTVASLSAVLSYTNDSVVDRFCAEFGIARTEALCVFKDMVRWLWLNATHTVVRWFEDYGETYSEQELLSRRAAVLQKRINALALTQ